MEKSKSLKAINPATGEIIAEIKETPIDEIDSMVATARQGFNSWSSLSIQERINYLKKLRIHMVEHIEEIARKISADTGKVKTDAIVADILPTVDAISHIEKHAKKILEVKRVKTPILLFGKKSYIQYKPRGVVLVISPWNYPLQLSMVPMISALVSGNSVILKPSEVTPLVGKCIEELFLEAGFPKGVVQVAHGGKELGAALTEKVFDYIFFTGSVSTGKLVQKAAAQHLTPTTLELGGKDPTIIFEDANIDRAVLGVLWGALTNCGQVCMSTERVYVQKSIYETFLSKLLSEVQKLKQGTNDDDDLGSMTFFGQINILKEHLLDVISNGGKIETGINPLHMDESSMFLSPTIITNVSQHSKVIQEESFGPLIPIIPFDTEEQAIQLANDSKFGLNASIWSSNLSLAKRVARQLDSGSVVINDVIITVANHYLPFGGAKQSGIGNYHGENGLKIFCHEQAVMIDKGKKKSEVQWYPYHGKSVLFVSLIKSYFGQRKNLIQFLNAYLKLSKKD